MDKTDASREEKFRPDDREQRALFDPPLFPGEETRYDQLLAQICRVVQPADFLEHMWVLDVVYFTIEVLRLRRVKRDLMTVNAYKGLSEILTPLVGRSHADTLGQAWAAGNSDVMEEVNKVLTSAGLSHENVQAKTFSLQLDEIERIEKLAALTEARRNGTLHEIDRHRETLGHKLRQAARQIEDGQFRLVESTSPSIGM